MNILKTASMAAPSLDDRIRASLLGLYVADATAMPVHWMYNLNFLKRDYGQITGYARPLDHFEGSIMNKSNTGGAGRGSNQGSIIGDVINHGKKQYWTPDQQNHYHLGLQAGENTLEAQLTRLVTRSIIENNAFEEDAFRAAYVKFMQTPGSHNDCYAATAHRMFFANLVNGQDPKLCPDNDGHNVDAIDALTVSIPVILKYHNGAPDVRNQRVIESIKVIRGIKAVEKYAIMFSDMLVDVLNGKDVREVAQAAADKLGMGSLRHIVSKMKGDPMAACYIDSSFPVFVFLVYKYADSFESAVLANANAGGENVARGALVGALLGAAHGTENFPAWSKELHAKDEINKEIDNFMLTLQDAKKAEL